MLSTLQGVTPELLGEYVERTPPPRRDRRPSTNDAVRALPVVRRRASLGNRRRCSLAGLGVLLLLVAGAVWWFAIRDTRPSYEPGPFHVHAWVPPWNIENALDDLDPRANMFHQISPFWYEVTGVSTIQPYANTPGGDRRVRRRAAHPQGSPSSARCTTARHPA